MLRKYIELRERQAYEADAQRLSLPFGWGAEFVGVTANGNPHESLREFSAHALRSSDTFFACDPADSYALNDGLLTFPSAVITNVPENNTAWGRVFEAD